MPWFVHNPSQLHDTNHRGHSRTFKAKARGGVLEVKSVSVALKGKKLFDNQTLIVDRQAFSLDKPAQFSNVETYSCISSVLQWKVV